MHGFCSEPSLTVPIRSFMPAHGNPLIRQCMNIFIRHHLMQTLKHAELRLLMARHVRSGTHGIGPRAGVGLALRMCRELLQGMGGAHFFRRAMVTAIFPVDVFHGSCMISDGN